MRRQKWEVAGHIVSRVRKQRERNSGAQPALLFLFLSLLYSVCSLSSYSDGFLASGNLRVDALVDTSRGMAPRWLSNPVRLTIAIKQHTST